MGSSVVETVNDERAREKESSLNKFYNLNWALKRVLVEKVSLRKGNNSSRSLKGIVRVMNGVWCLAPWQGIVRYSWLLKKLCFFSRSRGVQPFGISGPHWKKKSCLGPHIKYTNTNKNWWAKIRVLSKFMILCWAAFLAILGHMWAMGCGLDTPAGVLRACPQVLFIIHVDIPPKKH